MTLLCRIGSPKEHRRLDYALWLVSMADTVIISTCEEVQAVIDRALAGEFDDDI